MRELAHDDLNPAAPAPPATPPATPLVLVHGFPLDRRIFTEVAPMLAAGRRVLTVDLAGFGQSESRGAFTLDDQATWLRGLLERKGCLPCVLGGLSMGGYVAQAYLTRFAGDLKGLILIDTKSTADTEEGKAGRVKMAELALSTAEGAGAAGVAEQMRPKMLGDTTRRTRPDLEPKLVEIMHACPPATIAAACLAMRDRPDYTPDLAAMTVPLLMITGEEDVIAPVSIGRSVAAAAGSRGTFAAIPGAGHIATMEQPEAVAKAITGWLSACGL